MVKIQKVMTPCLLKPENHTGSWEMEHVSRPAQGGLMERRTEVRTVHPTPCSRTIHCYVSSAHHHAEASLGPLATPS